MYDATHSFLFNIIATSDLRQIWDQIMRAWPSCWSKPTYSHPKLIGSPSEKCSCIVLNSLVRNSIVCPCLSEICLVYPPSKRVYLLARSRCPLSWWIFFFHSQEGASNVCFNNRASTRKNGGCRRISSPAVRVGHLTVR